MGNVDKIQEITDRLEDIEAIGIGDSAYWPNDDIRLLLEELAAAKAEAALLRDSLTRARNAHKRRKDEYEDCCDLLWSYTTRWQYTPENIKTEILRRVRSKTQ